MKTPLFPRFLLIVVACMAMLSSHAFARAKIKTLSREPYLGAMALDVATGKILYENKADAQGYPASVVKLMDLLIVLEKVRAGQLRLSNKVSVTARASRMGGSQVYLKEGEVFTIEELLYAIMVQSGNDAAMALAIRVAGTPEAFVKLMNQRAQEIGMNDTVFHSVHGLPPGTGQKPDVTTACDLALLGREIVRHCPEALRYTATKVRGFRKNTFIMRNHNRLLGKVQGVDGLKTGYFRAGGFSMLLSAKRDNRYVVVAVLGSKVRQVRDLQASEILAQAFLNLPPLPKKTITLVSPPAVAKAPDQPGAGCARADDEPDKEPKEPEEAGWGVKLGIAVLILFSILTAINLVIAYRRDKNFR